MSQRLGELLVKEKVISPAQLDEALGHQKRHGGRLGSALVKLRLCSEDEVASFLSRQYGVPALNLKDFEIDRNVLKLVPRDVAEQNLVVPLSRNGISVTLAMTDPSELAVVQTVEFSTGLKVIPVVATESQVVETIGKYYHDGIDQDKLQDVIDTIESEGPGAVEVQQDEAELDPQGLERAAEEAPVVRLVNAMLFDAVRRGASDIHVEPYEKEFRVRYRIDGILQEIMSPPLRLRDAVISRIKIMAKLDISEKRLPQDGRIMLKMTRDGRKRVLDLRVSILPTLFGEKIVMRLLDKENLRLDMTRLGFEPESLAQFQEAIHKPYGMVLVTGPTGSGKTNTLYSSVAQLNTPDVNIITAEDPVEFQLPGINQVQMKEQIGLNFAAALRSFLRQDPNIILVGEIRDFETAEISVKAALTGHLVLSTVHTNDAPSTISRLMNMGIEPFLVATSVHLICAQRLVRRICTQCPQPQEVPLRELLDLGYAAEEAKGVRVFKGAGCSVCNNTGYKGRLGLYEVMVVDEAIRELILVGASAVELKKKAIERGMVTLRRSGLIKAAQGLTTIEEVLRETVL
ncbi:MAG: type IV-A pilus assembly ATPase PilB [Terriglobales bacterium]